MPFSSKYMAQKRVSAMAANIIYMSLANIQAAKNLGIDQGLS